MNSPTLTRKEFVALMALLSSMVALAIDCMLPAFSKIQVDLNVQSTEDLHWIIGILFFGYGLGQLVFGPLADRMGRKPPVYIGLFFFLLGALLSGLSWNYGLFLFGRFLQGFGGAGPRTVALAIVRDRYQGESMAQITSMITSVFILVPAIAPSLGALILVVSSWRGLFILLALAGLLTLVWFKFRQVETLPPEKRRPISGRQLMIAAKYCLTQPTTFSCILLSGTVFSVFIGYLGSAEHIFSDMYDQGQLFPVFFGLLALCIGTASLVNSRIVMLLGIRTLLFRSAVALVLSAALFLFISVLMQADKTPLWLFLGYMMVSFFCVGFLFGNLNALAMSPLGSIAGFGSALVGCLQSLISVLIGAWLGTFFYQDVRWIGVSYFVIGLFCLVVLKYERDKFFESQVLKTSVPLS